MSIQTDMEEGWRAGWRGDEIVIEKSVIYMEWYEIGQTEREVYQCQSSTNSPSEADGQSN